jgi:hypothetical protein
MHEVPLPKEPFLALDEQERLAGEDEEAIGRSAGMDVAERSDTPANELEALVTDLSASGPVIFVFGNGWLTTHLVGATRPLFRGPSDRRWWHVEHGDPESKWGLDVRLDRVERVRFSRESKFVHVISRSGIARRTFRGRRRPDRSSLLPRGSTRGWAAAARAASRLGGAPQPLRRP